MAKATASTEASVEETATGTTRRTAASRENVALSFIKANATLIALVVLVAILSVADDTFLTPRNLSNLARQITFVGIVGVGMTMVILIGGIDLSVGSVVGLSAIVVTLSCSGGSASGWRSPSR